MKKKIVYLFGIWIIFFILISFTARQDLDFVKKIGCSLIYALIMWIGLCFGEDKGKNVSSKNRKPSPAPKKKDIYIYRGMERKYLYRFDGKYIYEGLNSKFVYRVEGNKIYRGMESKYLYRIEGNKIYMGMDNKPLYRIDGNYIYSGNFGNKPVFRISNNQFE